MTTTKIKEEVRAILSEPVKNNGLAALTVSPDVLNLDNTIEALLPIAVCLCSKLSPMGGVNVGDKTINYNTTLGIPSKPTDFTNNPYSGASHTPRILPTDYLRLISIDIVKQEGSPAVITYYRPITRTYELWEEMAKAQWNTNTRSGIDNPVAVETWCGNDRCLDISPNNLTNGANIIGTLYYDKAYTSSGISPINNSYGFAVCYMIASLYYETMEESDAADRLRKIAYDLLGIKYESE